MYNYMWGKNLIKEERQEIHCTSTLCEYIVYIHMVRKSYTIQEEVMTGQSFEVCFLLPVAQCWPMYM